MKKGTLLRKHNRSANAILSFILITTILLLIIILLIISAKRKSPSPARTTITATPPTTTQSPTPIVATPVSVDLSTWKTYTDWKYGFSIKLPPQYYSTVPGKGRADPQGNGEMDFEDSLYRAPNNPYGFTVRIIKGNHLSRNCTTDEECFSILYEFFDHIPNLVTLQTNILQKDIKGIAIGNPPHLRYMFTKDQEPYELYIYDLLSTEQLLKKLPYIDVIASTISFQ